MTHGTCRLTAKNRDQLTKRTLGNRVWATFTFQSLNCVARSHSFTRREMPASPATSNPHNFRASSLCLSAGVRALRTMPRYRASPTRRTKHSVESGGRRCLRRQRNNERVSTGDGPRQFIEDDDSQREQSQIVFGRDAAISSVPATPVDSRRS